MTRLILSLVVFSCFSTYAQLDFKDEEDSKREKYGLSQAEWRIYKESGMSEGDLESLIKCGITMNEYNSRPWVTMGVSEKDWIHDRCKGLNDQDIQAFKEKGEGDHGVIFSFLLPGSYHLYSRSYVKGFIFSGVFVGSITLYFALPAESDPHSVAVQNGGPFGEKVTEKKPRIGFLVLGLADMVTSAVFAYRDIHKEKLEDKAAHWTLQPVYAEGPGLRYEYRF